MLYIIKSIKSPSQAIIPWFLTSDPVEHLWAALRTGRYGGRRTNLTSNEVLQGARKLNRSITLVTAQNHLLEPTNAHTRGKTLIPYPEEERIYYGRQVTTSGLKTAMQHGFNQS